MLININIIHLTVNSMIIIDKNLICQNKITNRI
jgi:hypothetical protein